MTKVAAIETKGLCIGYLLKGGKRKVVHEDLNLQLVSGEETCLLGLNGAGKSTLLRTLCGFQPPLGGEIRLMGKPLSGYSQANFSLTVGVVLTEKTNAGGITVYELVSLKSPMIIVCGAMCALSFSKVPFMNVDDLAFGT